MFSAKSSLSIKIGEREYQFLCDPNSPLQELIDVLGIVLKNAQKLLEEASAKKEEIIEPEIVDG